MPSPLLTLTSPAPPSAPGYALLRVGTDRWRVIDRRGRILGHIRALRESSGWRYCAERFDQSAAAFREVGRFWRGDEALECLRYAR